MNRKFIKLIIFLFLFFPTVVMAESVSVNTFDELKNAILNNESEIIIDSDISFNSSISISTNVVIDGNGHVLSRNSNYLAGLFNVSSTGDLTIKNITIECGAPNWTMDFDNRYYTGANDTGYVRVPTLNYSNDLLASASLVTNSGNLKIEDSTIKNAFSSVSGSILKGTGNSSIKNSTIEHTGSKASGGSIYLTGGMLELINSTFKGNVAGVSITGGAHGGAIYASDLSSLKIIDNCLFEDNLSQANAGAIYIIRSNAIIKNSVFRHNMCGNDGSALDLLSKVEGKTLSIEDSLFESNYGMASTGQSMGTVYLEQWISSKAEPIIFKNLKFTNNVARTGGAIADYASGGNTNVNMENIEVSENNVNSGALVYVQSANYVADKLYVHDNVVNSGAAFYISGSGTSEIQINNSLITNNTGTGSGIGIYLNGGSVTIRNSEISNNTSTGARGAGIMVRGYYEGINPSLVVENTIIRNNTAETTGGGIAVGDKENVFSSITIDDKTKIYDNNANGAGDDFSYVRDNNSANTTDNTITLTNISIAGLIGIDGWYNDEEENRFRDNDNPTVFTSYVENDGSISFFLKAAGLNSATYDGNGGNAEITPITVKYGETYVVDDNIPSRDGYDFVEWNTKPDGTGISLKVGDSYDGSEGFVLYAIWNKSNIENPPTADGIVMWLVMFKISVIEVITGLALLYKKRVINK